MTRSKRCGSLSTSSPSFVEGLHLGLISGFWLDAARRAIRRPPGAVIRRLAGEVRAELERLEAPRRGRSFDTGALCKATHVRSVDELWERSGAREPFPDQQAGALSADETEAILDAGSRALDRTVDLLGSGPVQLGRPIDWSRDYKSGVSWPRGFARRLSYVDPNDQSDVKFPWELSRMQWLIPAGQAYVLTGDERYAQTTREILEEWISANPYALTINWAIAMEPALRVLTWTWLFHALRESVAWRDRAFRSLFLRSLYLQADWVERNLERSDVNGNHYTADAAGLVFAGLLLGEHGAPARWAKSGWQILQSEIGKQVFDDGVDFEGSTAYHRLVTELFLLPAVYRERLGLKTPTPYRERLISMARFVAAYSRDDGTSPQWGDADDGRALPLGSQALGDHRYLIGLVGGLFDVAELNSVFSGPLGEVAWILGPDVAGRLSSVAGQRSVSSAAFEDAGVYVMRSRGTHVFIDAGPVGMRGRGGHGHNDCLSVDAVLDGVQLVVDPGAYVYTSSYEWRNRFRSTAFHNTPVIDNEEQNRFVDVAYLWSLRDDAKPTVERWLSDPFRDVLTASHSGYQRLTEAVTVARTVILDKKAHRLLVRDTFRGAGEHSLLVPFHLTPLASVTAGPRGVMRIVAEDRAFELHWEPADSWRGSVIDGWTSPSYGVKHLAPIVQLTRSGVAVPLLVVIAARGSDRPELLRWAAEALSIKELSAE